MKIGLTYDLRREYLDMGYSEEETAEFDSDETISAIENALRACGHYTERIGNIFTFVKSVAYGKRWDLVFNIAEGMYGLTRESQIPSLCEAYRIPCVFSDALVCSLAHHKPTTKRLVASIGMPTPPFAIIASEEDMLTCSLPFPVFVKPVAEGTSKGITSRSVIHAPQALAAAVSEILCTYHQPAMVESFLPGREVTVGIIGTGSSARVAGVLEIAQKSQQVQPVYSYHAKEHCEQLIRYRLIDDLFAEQAADMALCIWKEIGCRDAGRIDFRADETGTPSFLEINPLAGLHPTHSDLPIMWRMGGGKYNDLIAAVVDSARRRVSHRNRPPVTNAVIIPSAGDRKRKSA